MAISHYQRKIWPQRKWKEGENIVNERLVAREDVLLPPLYIKLGLIKKFANATNSAAKVSFKISFLVFLQQKQRGGGVFVGVQVKELQKYLNNVLH